MPKYAYFLKSLYKIEDSIITLLILGIFRHLGKCRLCGKSVEMGINLLVNCLCRLYADSNIPNV